MLTEPASTLPQAQAGTASPTGREEISIARHMSRACTSMRLLPHWPSREDGVVAEDQVSSEPTYFQTVRDIVPVLTVPAMLCDLPRGTSGSQRTALSNRLGGMSVPLGPAPKPATPSLHPNPNKTNMQFYS